MAFLDFLNRGGDDLCRLQSYKITAAAPAPAAATATTT